MQPCEYARAESAHQLLDLIELLISDWQVARAPTIGAHGNFPVPIPHFTIPMLPNTACFSG